MKIPQLVFVDGTDFLDADGRTLLFRGCSLGGDSKLPVNPGSSAAECSFVGRPFGEAEADLHFARLASWGFNLVRFVITWEAVEHAGPGVYDEAYLSYLRNVIKAAERHGILVYLDPHQDVWSRFSGGSGAPGWTLEAVGFDLSKLAASGAADPEGPWPLNYHRYACATMFTLFFAGNRLAPGRYIEGVNVQDWLQDHFIEAMRHTARRLKDCANLIGFGTFNEPHSGFIALPSLDSRSRMLAEAGMVPTAFEAMTAASGFTCQVEEFRFFGHRRTGRKGVMNPSGVSLFREGCVCPWREAGVWGLSGGEPVALKQDYFARVDFTRDCLQPFIARFIAELSRKHGHYVFFTEGIPLGPRASWSAESLRREDGTRLQVAEAFHWYEGFLLMTKRWRPYLAADGIRGKVVLGKSNVRRSVERQIAELADLPRREGIPALVGEFGIPFDLDEKRGYRTGDWSRHEEALSLQYEALDAALLHGMIWNYSATNTEGSGDGWNGEDLSVWNSETGVRALRGFSRPYPKATSGKPLVLSFDRKDRVFTYSWEGKPGRTEIYVPAHWYPEGWTAGFYPGESGTATVEERPEDNLLAVVLETEGTARLFVRPISSRD